MGLQSLECWGTGAVDATVGPHVHLFVHLAPCPSPLCCAHKDSLCHSPHFGACCYLFFVPWPSPKTHFSHYAFAQILCATSGLNNVVPLSLHLGPCP